MPKGKKKPKHKVKNPPLSPLNKFLYGVLFVLIIILPFSLYLIFHLCQIELGKAGGALALESTASELLVLIPIIPALGVCAGLWEIAYTDRVPLVGARKKRPPEPQKQKKPYSRAYIIFITAIVSVYLLSFVPAIGAVYNRVEINETHIDKYAMFGRQTEHRPVEDATAVHAEIYLASSGRYTYRWDTSYTVYFADGKSFRFTEASGSIAKIDALFEGVPKTVDGTENFEELCEEYDFTPEEQEQLRELFLMNK